MAMEHGLVEGVELGQGYAVRVRARNAAGWSPWSIESEQVRINCHSSWTDVLEDFFIEIKAHNRKQIFLLSPSVSCEA